MDCADSDFNDFRDSWVGGFDTTRGALFDTRRMQAGRIAGGGAEDLVAMLRRDGKPHLHRAEAEALAMGETSFFRDMPMFEELRERILPALLTRRATERRLHIWSAGCSTGQETYSLAMILIEHFPALVGWDVRVVGTDTSEAALQYAQGGRYRRSEVERGLPEHFLNRHMKRDAEGWTVSESVRELCQFVCEDLREESSESSLFDLVLLRNVLLYLAPTERDEVLKRGRRQMASDGVLILGASERAEDSTALFAGELTPGCSVYRPANGG